jgi:hypothetical protein
LIVGNKKFSLYIDIFIYLFFMTESVIGISNSKQQLETTNNSKSIFLIPEIFITNKTFP